MDMNFGKLWEMVRDREASHAAVMGLRKVGHDLATEQQQSEAQKVKGQFKVCRAASETSTPDVQISYTYIKLQTLRQYFQLPIWYPKWPFIVIEAVE